VRTDALRVLVVDENTVERRTLRRWGEELGWRVEEAAAPDAIEVWLRATRPADRVCVFWSLASAPRDWPSALEAFLVERPRLTVIVLTSGESAEVLARAWRAGAAGALGKSELSKEALHRVVGHLLGPTRASEPWESGRADGEQPLRVMQAVCHDLRNPLSAVMINANLLLREGSMSDERRAKTANRILASSHRMNRMLEDLSDYALAAEGKAIPLRPSDADLLAIATDVVAQTRAVYPGHALVLEPRGELRGYWDPARLRQALLNLLGSALKRGRPGSTAVLGCSELGSPAEVEIRLEHRVPLGLEAPTFPIPEGTERLPRSTGGMDGADAGLYVARRIVEAHQGSFTATASVDGPAFLIRLPKRTQDAPA
jgi:signal transduction histidine kinase